MRISPSLNEKSGNESLSVVSDSATQWTNLQDRIWERVAVPFSRRSSQPRDPIQVSCNAGGFVGGGGGGF